MLKVKAYNLGVKLGHDPGLTLKNIEAGAGVVGQQSQLLGRLRQED